MRKRKGKEKEGRREKKRKEKKLKEGKGIKRRIFHFLEFSLFLILF